VVWKLSRLGRSTPHLYAILERLQRLGAELHSVTEGIDTHTAAGRAMFGMLAVMAQFEREVLVENTLAGLAAARAQGHTGGRRPAITGTRLAVAHRLLSEGQSVTQVATILGVARSTVYRALRAEVDAAVER
jgi:DNA invertase Pin-like site-specific DNA recombinase